MNYKIEILSGISQINAPEWNALTDGSPILSHAFLAALEATGCVGPGTGWQPYPLTVKDGNRLVGAVPLYLKSHSYGEYVFDWAWADAFERNGLSYYPKLLAAIPFTPVTGVRLMSRDGQIQELMAQVLAERMEHHSLSSVHILFPNHDCSQILENANWIKRVGVQFRWENESFTDFEDFLSRLAHDKRKKIHQERKKIMVTGINCRKLTGDSISRDDWDFFFRCYENTYYQHHSTPYLTREFFYALGERMPQQVLLVLAERAGKPIAAALNLFNGEALYGRYWGAVEYVPGLHFELCYYQAQEFCIDRGIRYFEGGAQGEHKLARGFRPRATCSFHKIAHPEFEAAIRQFVRHEARGMDVYHNELEERAPYKS